MNPLSGANMATIVTGIVVFGTTGVMLMTWRENNRSTSEYWQIIGLAVLESLCSLSAIGLLGYEYLKSHTPANLHTPLYPTYGQEYLALSLAILFLISAGANITLAVHTYNKNRTTGYVYVLRNRP